jgi:Copper amine oxidase N-terminal domain
MIHSVPITVAERPIAASAVVRNAQVLLPLRETFEALNSVVVYDPADGIVEARNILHVLRMPVHGSGSTTLDGRPISVTPPPMTIHGKLYVPLSLAANAMGAIVRYDPHANIVAVNGSYRGKERIDPAHPPRELNPPPESTVQTGYPVISASLGDTFAASNAVRLSVDGVDVTQQARFDGRTITYIPQAALMPGRHAVAFDGTIATGQGFSTHWNFANAAAAMPIGDVAAYGYQFYGGPSQSYAGGSWFNFTLIGPPAGSGFVQICNPNFIYPLWNGASRFYRARLALPSAYIGGNCAINGVYIGPNGQRIIVPISNGAGNGLYITGNPINPLGSYPSTPLFVPVLPTYPIRRSPLSGPARW